MTRLRQSRSRPITVPDSTLHIDCHAAPEAPQHVLDDAGTCWCGPDVQRLTNTTVVAHAGSIRPAVRASLNVNVDLSTRRPSEVSRVRRVTAWRQTRIIRPIFDFTAGQ